MASTKECRDFILERLVDVLNITYRPMMGEFLLYFGKVLFGGIYDDHLLVNKVPENAEFDMGEVLPYDGAKTSMCLVDDTDDNEKLSKIATVTIEGLKWFEFRPECFH